MEAMVLLVLNVQWELVLLSPLNTSKSQTFLLLCMVMVLLIKVNYLKQLIWLKSGNYLAYLSVKTINMLWELLQKDIHKIQDSTKEVTKSQVSKWTVTTISTLKLVWNLLKSGLLKMDHYILKFKDIDIMVTLCLIQVYLTDLEKKSKNIEKLTTVLTKLRKF